MAEPKKPTLDECDAFAAEALKPYPYDTDPRNGIKIIPYDLARTAAMKAVHAALTAERKATCEEIESWKRRAAQHGCDVENGDDDCG